MTVSPVADGVLDPARMCRERLARLHGALEEADVAGALLVSAANVRYATGADIPGMDGGRAIHTASVAFVQTEGGSAHLFTAYPEGAAAEHPRDRLHERAQLETVEGAQEFVERLRDLIGDPISGRIAIDELPAPLFVHLAELLPRLEPIDAAPIMSSARVLKTRDEVECIRRAQHINELAMYDARAALRPGVRQNELSAILLSRAVELGATSSGIDPIWQVMPSSIDAGPLSVTGEIVFPTPPTDRVLREGDVIWVDSGLGYNGYQSDFGRTWIVGREPTTQQRDNFRRWRAVMDRVLEEIRPGVSGADLTRAAHEVEPRTPWPSYFYLAHGVGLGSAEAPLIGTDLGQEFDASIELRPGMILVLEPAIWDDDGSGGYRSEEIVVVTEDGYQQLSDHPYDPYF